MENPALIESALHRVVKNISRLHDNCSSPHTSIKVLSLGKIALRRLESEFLSLYNKWNDAGGPPYSYIEGRIVGEGYSIEAQISNLRLIIDDNMGPLINQLHEPELFELIKAGAFK